MKKQLLLLTLLLLCSTAAWAATEYGIYVAGTKVTSNNCNNIVNSYITSGTVVYTPSSKTLTLTNVTINTGTTDNNGINNYDCDGLIVKFVGTCKLAVDNRDKSPISVEEKTYVTVASGTTTLTQSAINGNCINVDDCQLFINGTGKLNLISSNGFGLVCTSSSVPVNVNYQNNCDVTITSAKNGLRRGYHRFYDGTVTIKATNNGVYPNVAITAMTLNNSSVITAPDGAYFDASTGSSDFHNVRVNGTSVFNQDIVITNKYYLLLNSTNFPDANLRANLRSLYPKGYMTQAEVDNLTKLIVSSKNISSMKGVEKLTALTKLICYNNPLTSLDVTALTNLTYLDVGHTESYSGTKLTTLNVSSCTKLENLYCYNNNITSLDLSNCSALKGLYCYKTKLTSLSVTDKSNLTTLDCSGCTSMTSLDCYGNNLTSLNVAGNTALKDLCCYRNANLASITGLADCTSITFLQCDNCKITDLSAVNSLTKLVSLCARNNKMTTFTLNGKSSLYDVRLEGNTSLTKAEIYNNSNLIRLIISDCPALAELRCTGNALVSLDVGGNIALKNLRCYNNIMHSITGLADCTAMTYLDCEDCMITDLSAVNSLTKLQELYACNNKLTTFTLNGKSSLTYVRLSGNTSLTQAEIYNNSKLATLYVTDCPALKTLYCYGNALTKLDLTGNTAITVLNCYKNQLTSLNVSPLTKLATLNCYENPSLTSITGLANCASTLTFLDACDCNLASLDVSSLSKLKVLNCWNNRITSLNVNGKTALIHLNCCGNQLTSLYVQGCTALQRLYCYQNKFTDAGMTTLVNSLPTRSASSKGELYVLYNTGENNVFTSAHAAAAAAKNWNPYRYGGYDWVLITATTRGDVDNSGNVSIDDVTTLINYLLTRNATGVNLSGADCDNSGNVSIDDVTTLINYLLTKSW